MDDSSPLRCIFKNQMNSNLYDKQMVKLRKSQEKEQVRGKMFGELDEWDDGRIIRVKDNKYQYSLLTFHIIMENDHKKSYHYPILLEITIFISLGAFYYGYTLTYFNSVQYSLIVRIYHLQTYPPALTQGLLTGSSAITAAIGSLVSYFLLKNYSRLKCLIYLNICAIIAGIFCLIPNASVFILFRLIQGLLVGAFSVINPSYMREMMPKEISGKLWTLHQVLFTLGLASGFILVFLFSRVMGLEEQFYWRIVFGFTILTCAAELYFLKFFYPYDTPKYLISIKNYQQARKVLSIIYEPEFIQRQFNEIAKNFLKISIELKQINGNNLNQKLIEQSPLQSEINKVQILPTNTIAIIAGINLAISQQFAGQPAVVQYGVQLTNRTFPSLWNTFPVIINLSGSVGALISVIAIQKFGRKELIIKGGIFMAIVLLLIAFLFSTMNTLDPQNSPFLPRLLICMLIIALRTAGGISIGPITWLIMSEILQPHLVSVGGACNWIALATVNILFPLLLDVDDQGNPWFAFLCFSIIIFVAIGINAYTIIETGHKSQLQIRREYEQKWPSK